MVYRIFLFFFFLQLPFHVFPLGKSNPESLREMKRIELKDKSYRVIGVIPFQNETGSDDYHYLGTTIQKFLSEYLEGLKTIIISTDEFFIPQEYRTNQVVSFSYGTNFLRNALILKSDKIANQYKNIPNVESLSNVIYQVHADFLVHGQYTFYRKNNEKFSIDYKIYSKNQNKNIFSNNIIFDSKNVERDIKEIGQILIQFFKRKQPGFLKIITLYSNREILIDETIVNNQVLFYTLPEGKHKIVFKLIDQTWITNISINKFQTNYIFFTNRVKNQAILKINSKPTNAQVFLNINFLGQTPLQITNVKQDKYRLTVSKSNYTDYYQNIEVKKGTNIFNVSLQKSQSISTRLKEYKRNKIIMYSSLGFGALAILNTYYFLSKASEEDDKLNLYGKEENYNKRNHYYDISIYSGLAALGGFTVSFIYFLKVLNYDDVNIGSKIPYGFTVAENANTKYFLFHYRF